MSCLGEGNILTVSLNITYNWMELSYWMTETTGNRSGHHRRERNPPPYREDCYRRRRQCCPPVPAGGFHRRRSHRNHHRRRHRYLRRRLTQHRPLHLPLRPLLLLLLQLTRNNCDW